LFTVLGAPETGDVHDRLTALDSEGQDGPAGSACPAVKTTISTLPDPQDVCLTLGPEEDTCTK